MLISLWIVLSLAGGTTFMNMVPPGLFPPEDLISLDRCPIPRSVFVRGITDASAEIAWFSSDSALQVDLQWRETGAPDWLTISEVQSPLFLEGLSPCLAYEVRLQAHCNGSDSEYSPITEFEADGCCRIPSNLHVLSANTTSAVVSWDAVSFAFVHHVRYKALADLDWIEEEVDTNLINIGGLDMCAMYEIQVGSQCDLDSTEYSASLIFQTTDCGSCTSQQYCASAGDDASAEWIDSLAFGAIRMRSGMNDGYLLLNTTQTGIERRRSYVFHLTPGTTLTGAEFYLRMWIDLNQDGQFTDSTELLVDPSAAITESGWTQPIFLEDTVALGQTRMRVALKSVVGADTIRPEACGNFLFGEVEDYCISIDDVCPEIEPVLRSVTETSAVISWSSIDQSIVFIYRYRNVEDTDFSDPELTMDTIIEISGLSKCEEYLLQTLNVCVQDTSSWQEFLFKTECPNAVSEILPLADEIEIYPNPFTDQLTLTLSPLISGTATLRFINIMGMELEARTLFLEQGIFQQIRLENLDALQHGMYLVYLETKDRRQVLKVIK